MKSDTPKSGLLTFGIAFTGVATLGFMVADGIVRPPLSWLSLMPTYCLAAFALLHSLHSLGTRRTLWFLCLGLILPFVAEYLGSNFGAVFGSHWFLRARDLHIDVGLMLPGNVPLSIVLTWYGMLYVVFLASVYLLRSKPQEPSSFAAVPMAAGLLMALWQLAAGPFAMVRHVVGYAQDGFYHGIPLASFAGWYVTTMFIILFFQMVEPGAADAEHLARAHFTRRAALWMLVGVLLYPAAMCFRYGMFGAGWLGVAVILLVALALAIRTRTLTTAAELTEAPVPTA